MERKEVDDIDQEKGERELKEPLLVSRPSKGGVRTLPFILATEGFERAASFGLQPNMIIYLMEGYSMDMATGSNIIFMWSAASSFTAILGAFLADSCVGRFRMIGFGSIFSLMGMLLLWSTTVVSGARPSCEYSASNNFTCTSPTAFHLILICSSFGLMSIGAGGIRSSTMAFGADQLGSSGHKATPGGILERFFNWYYFAVSFSLLFALTIIVYIQDHMGWTIGFGVPLFLMLISIISFFLASSFYVKAKPKPGLLTGIARVLVASWSNRHYELPSQQNTESVYHVAKGSSLQSPSEKLRFLNKACMLNDPEQELNPDGTAINPWHLCTTDQVEECKTIMSIIPLWSTGILFGVNANQTSFQVLQANSMDRHVLSQGFEIPAGSFGTFTLITVILWLFLYDRVIIPVASKVLGKPFRIDAKTRMGAGLLVTFVAMVVSGVVESIRRDTATRGPLSTENVKSISALWLVPQVCLIGLAEALTAVGQIEFFYSELPKSMSCIASNLYGLGFGIASLAGSVIMSLVDHVTKRGGKESWVSSDINQGHYDYYYWVLAGLNLVNYMYFLLCSRAYGAGKRVFQEAKDITSEE